jgi:glycosyltransferase involved in cell wall biosynthesis
LRRVLVIPNAIPFDSVATEIRPDPIGEAPRIVAVGRLGPEKRHDLLIDAFALQASRHVAWTLWIWGEGPCRSLLEEKVRVLGLAGRVHLPGVTHEPWSELAKADIFALTSEFEGFPNAMLEAMALAVPCVATDCRSGPRELSGDGHHAVLVETGNAAAISMALGRLMSDAPARRELGRSAAEWVRQNFSRQIVLQKWNDLLVSLAH